MSTKVCNLDLIAPVQKRELVINGKTFEVEPLSVQMFIEFNQMRQSLTDEKAGIEQGLLITKKMIKKAIPTMPEKLIDGMSINHLQLVVAFINDEIPDEVLKREAHENKNDKEEKEEGANAETESGNWVTLSSRV